MPLGIDGFQGPERESVQDKASKSGKCRVKARHLSPILRQVICDSFRAKRSSEDVADDLHLPVRTVTDTLLLEAFRMGRASSF